jgi:thermitase
MFSVFGIKSRPLIAWLLVLAAGRCLFAGREFLAGPREQIVAGQLLVGLQPGADINQILSALVPQATASFINRERNTYLLNLPPGIQAAASQVLAAHPLVNYVEPNRIRNTTVVPPNDAMLTQQWALTTIQAVQAWSYFPDHYLTASTAGANRVKVAILDTGADCTHPDFMNAGGASTDSAQGGQLDWTDSLALTATTISSPACPWEDDDGHGTHTAGILAAATDNAAGVASLGFPLQLVVIKTSNAAGTATDAVVAQGIYAAIGAGAQVVSMSLGGAGYSQTMQEAMDSAWQHNVLVVAAAGNSGDTTLIYPGAGNYVLGVAATDDTNARAKFSTYGNWIKIAAPGVNILSTLPTYGSQYGTSYGTLQGTSMSTPHVAALGGLLFAANPGISVAAVAQRIQQTAQSPNTGWNEYIGYGVIDAGAALAGIPGPFTQGSLTGQVIEPNGNPVTGAVVTAGDQSYTTAVDPNTGGINGLFRINLNPGTYAIAVSAPGYTTVNMQGVVVAGADTMLTVQMGVPYGEFTGVVTYNGVGVAGAVVEAVSGGLIRGAAVTNASGSYTLSVQPGTYTLTASAPNYINTASASQSLSANGTVTVSLALSALGDLAGTVTDLNGVGVANAHIDFSNGSFSGGAVTGAGGSYSTFGLPAGTYTVTASAPGYSSVSATGVSVTANTSTPVNLRFSTGVPVVSACDITLGSTTSVADVQKMIDEALGLAQAANDLNGDGVVNVLDVQIVIDAVMNLGCSAS